MMRMALVCSVLCAVVALGLCPRIYAQQCPAGCYYNQTPMAGHGAAPDGSGRRVINIYVDSSFGSSSPSGVTSKPAIRGHFKTGQRTAPRT